MHVCAGRLATKVGSNLLIRRAHRATPLVVALILNQGILKVTSDGLSKILTAYGSRLRKNASKTQKTKSICQLPIVTELVPKEKIDELLKTCEDMDAARRKRSSQRADDEESDENVEAARAYTKKQTFRVLYMQAYSSKETESL